MKKETTNKYFDIQYRFFLVNEKTFCLWETDIQADTLKYLESIDPEYFTYLADTHLDTPTEDISPHASIALRQAYSQGLETLFSLIASALQAPQCVQGWVSLYRMSDLLGVVEKIHRYKPIHSLVKENPLSWSKVSSILFTWLVLEDKEKELLIKEEFAKLWSRFAIDFLDQSFRNEYNSIKHGLRVKPGGFQLAIGAQGTPGIPAKKENMRLLGKSNFGSSFSVVEKKRNKNFHIRLRNHHRNWNPEDFGWSLHLISLSISNIIAALKILNGVSAEEVKFNWPSELDSFSESWKRTQQLGVTSMSGFQTIIPDELIIPFTKEEILSKYLEGKDAGHRRILLNGENN